ncbi:MAG TPA: hypothetical protein VHL14_00135, partial [Steroidobacteraceae bacterium]|nr:hypothetical protein [Steroidobacteraceae bacterium]
MSSSSGHQSTTSVHVVCGHCSAVVRVPSDRLAQQPHCPQCHQSIFSGHPVNLDSANFDKHVERSDVPVV